MKSWTMLAVLVAVACSHNASRATVTQSAVTPSDPDAREWLQLFDGKDLNGWKIKFAGHPLGENFRNTYRVENGVLEVRYDQWPDFNGEFGHIFYERPFSYYLVAAEYRFVGNQVKGAGPDLAWGIRNNGIMIHSQSPESMGLNQDFPIS